MQKALSTLVLAAALTGPVFAQAPAAAPAPVAVPPVTLKAEDYTAIDKIQVQLAEAREDEAAALSNYEAKAAMRVVYEQALQVAVLKALMAVGVTDPTREIAAPPKPAAEQGKP